MSNKYDFIKKLNLGYLNVIDEIQCEENGFPCIGIHRVPKIDYISLYKDRAEYLKTENTAVGFYEYDETFDGPNGLWNSIVYDDQKKLHDFVERFKGCKYIIEPDYTVAGDLPDICNNHASFKARVVGAWLKMNTSAEIIPNISYVNEKSLTHCFKGIEEGSFMAYSTKGNLRGKEGRDFICKSINVAIDSIHPIGILIFTTSSSLSENDAIFDYAKKHEVKILIPETRARSRNEFLVKKWRK